MRLKVLGCEVFFREVCLLAANSPHTIDLAFLPKGLHDLGVERMVPRLQEQIDAVSRKGYDAVLLIYGLCNNGIVGLQARDTRLVVARAHDCITLFMGDRQRYLDYFHAHPGTYYRTTGWLEHADSIGAGEETVSQKLGLACEAPFRDLARREAEQRGWTFDQVEGSMELLRRAIHGEWDEDFLVVEPGQTVQATHDGAIIGSR